MLLECRCVQERVKGSEIKDFCYGNGLGKKACTVSKATNKIEKSPTTFKLINESEHQKRFLLLRNCS